VKKFRTMAIWLVLLVAVVFLVWLQNRDVKVTRPFSDFVTDVANDNVESVEITGNELTITDVQGTRYSTSGALTGELMEKLAEQDVPLRYGSDSGSSSRILLSWIIFLFPVVLLLAFLLYFLRKSKAGSANIMSMRRSLHREISAADGRVTFADVGGCEEAKEALGDVIDFLKTPSRWLNAGVRLPRGSCLKDLRVVERHCLRERLLEKRMRSSSWFRDRNSSKCSWESERHVFAICLRLRRKRRLPSFLSMK